MHYWECVNTALLFVRCCSYLPRMFECCAVEIVRFARSTIANLIYRVVCDRLIKDTMMTVFAIVLLACVCLPRIEYVRAFLFVVINYLRANDIFLMNLLLTLLVSGRNISLGFFYANWDFFIKNVVVLSNKYVQSGNKVYEEYSV